MGAGASSRKKRRITSSHLSSAVSATAPTSTATKDRKPADTPAESNANNSTSDLAKITKEKIINKSHSNVYSSNNKSSAAFSPSKPAYTPFREKAPKPKNSEGFKGKPALSSKSKVEHLKSTSEQKVQEHDRRNSGASTGVSRAAEAQKLPKTHARAKKEFSDEESDGQSYSDTSQEDNSVESVSKQKPRDGGTINETASSRRTSRQSAESNGTSEKSKAIRAQKPPKTPVLNTHVKENDSEEESGEQSIGHVSWEEDLSHTSDPDEDTDRSEHGSKSKSPERDQAATHVSSKPKKSTATPTPVPTPASENDGAQSQQKKDIAKATQRESRPKNDDAADRSHSKKLRGLLRQRHQSRMKATPKKFDPLPNQSSTKRLPTTQQRQLQMVLAQEQREDDRRRQRQMDKLVSQQQQFAWHVSSSRKLMHNHIHTIKLRAQTASPKEEDQFRRLLQQWRDLRIDKFSIKIQIQGDLLELNHALDTHLLEQPVPEAAIARLNGELEQKKTLLAQLNDDILRLDDAIKSCADRRPGRENIGASGGGPLGARSSVDAVKRPGPLYEIQVARDGKRLMAL